MEETLESPKKVDALIISQLREVAKNYGQPRRSQILYDVPAPAAQEEDDTPAYPVHLFFTREGYFKKITPQSLRMSGEQKLKEGDQVVQAVETDTRAHLLFFTDRGQVYKSRAAEFDDTKASVLGDYLPSKLGMEDGESVVDMVLPGDYSGAMLFFFENGKAARVELAAYATTSNRRRLTGAYSGKSPLAALIHLKEERELVLFSTEPRALIFHTALLAPKSTRTTQGVQVMTLKPKYHLSEVKAPEETSITNLPRYRCRAIPAAGALIREEDGDQMRLL